MFGIFFFLGGGGVKKRLWPSWPLVEFNFAHTNNLLLYEFLSTELSLNAYSVH